MCFVQKEGTEFPHYLMLGHRHRGVSFCTVVSYMGFFFLELEDLYIISVIKTGFFRFCVFGFLSTPTLGKLLISPSLLTPAIWWFKPGSVL